METNRKGDSIEKSESPYYPRSNFRKDGRRQWSVSNDLTVQRKHLILAAPRLMYPLASKWFAGIDSAMAHGEDGQDADHFTEDVHELREIYWLSQMNSLSG